MAGIVLYALVYQAWLWNAARSRAWPPIERLQPWTMAWCLSALLFLLGRFMQRSATDPAVAVDGVRIDYAAACLMGIVLVGIASSAAQRSVRTWTFAAWVGWWLVLAVACWATSGVVSDDAALRVDALGATYYAPRGGPWAFVLLATAVGSAVYAISMLRRANRRDPDLHRAITWVAILVPPLGINDVLMSTGLIRSVHLFEFGCTFIALALTYVHAQRYLRVYTELTDVVDERTKDLKLALTQAQRARRSAEALLTGSPDAILVVRDRRVVFANPAAARFLGHGEAESMVGQRLREVAPGLELDVRVGADPSERTFQRSNGETAVGEVACMQLDVDDAPAVVAIIRDVTQRHRMQAKLALADRLVSMGTLAAGLAHEINNPLTYVMANLDEVLRAIEEPGMQERVAEAVAGASRIAKIVSGVQRLSRSEDQSRAAIDVGGVIEGAIQMASHEIRHRATLVREQWDTASVMANEGRLGQVFLNLLVNAAHAIPAGDAHDNEIRVAVRNEDNSAVVEVTDTGAGIAPGVLDRIFDPFFTTKEIGEGTGLGLSICHSIVRELGGDIQVDSQLGRGTTFTVRLPAAAAAPPPEHVEQEAANASSSTYGRVLVVDDEPVVRLVLERALQPHDVTLAASGEDALRLCEEQDFGAVLCDVMMPQMAGPAFLKAICEKRPELADRIIFITGGAFSEELRAFLDTVPNAVVGKPFDLPVLRGLVARLVEDVGR